MHTNMKSDPVHWHTPLVVLMGMGTGRDDLSVKALRWIDRAEVLYGGERHLALFNEHRGKKIALGSPLEESLEVLRQVSETHRTIVLASGDPLFFGIGNRLIKYLGRERVLVFPNITTVQALFARLAEPWEDVKVVSLHGRKGAAEKLHWLYEVSHCRKTALFTDPQYTPAWVARQLLNAGITDRFLVVAEDLGMPSESIRHLSLQEAESMTFSPLSVVAVFTDEAATECGMRNAECGVDTFECGVRNLGDKTKNSVSATEGKSALSWPILGLQEGAFQHQAGLITKMEIRAVVLAQLQLQPGLVLWDLGAGSGSVAIEASRLVRLREVIAVEKDPARFQDLKENVKRFGCFEIQMVHGSASQVLDQLPDPDRVFIGGSGGELEGILQKVAQRLRPGGRIVQTVVTLDTLESVRSFWKEKPIQMTVAQFQINRGVPIGGTLRFEALNPVFIITVSV